MRIFSKITHENNILIWSDPIFESAIDYPAPLLSFDIKNIQQHTCFSVIWFYDFDNIVIYGIDFKSRWPLFSSDAVCQGCFMEYWLINAIRIKCYHVLWFDHTLWSWESVKENEIMNWNGSSIFDEDIQWYTISSGTLKRPKSIKSTTISLSKTLQLYSKIPMRFPFTIENIATARTVGKRLSRNENSIWNRPWKTNMTFQRENEENFFVLTPHQTSLFIWMRKICRW